MHRSKIEWTDYSGGYANFVRRGKRKGECECSPECAHCYVTRIWVRNPDAWPDETTIYPDKLEQLSRCRPRPNDVPYRRGEGSRPMVFVCDTGDLFHRKVPNWFILKALNVMAEREDIDWQILTKRAGTMNHVVNAWVDAHGWRLAPGHMWFGVSIGSSASRKRGLYLKGLHALTRWVSAEPLITPLDLQGLPSVPWLVIGGESGKNARRCELEWIRDLLKQSQMRLIKARFVKQLGSVYARLNGLHHWKGADPDEWPEDLRVREWPQ